jgi:ribosome-binding protein aMBF1 (putative translation factor)
MSRASVPWSEVEKRLLQDPEVAAALEELEPEYEIARQLIRARLERGMTQKQLAAKIGTRQSAISRIESGQQNVSIGMLKKAARGLDKKLQVTIG